MAREESLAEKKEKEEHGAWKEGRSWRLKRENLSSLGTWQEDAIPAQKEAQKGPKWLNAEVRR